MRWFLVYANDDGVELYRYEVDQQGREISKRLQPGQPIPVKKGEKKMGIIVPPFGSERKQQPQKETKRPEYLPPAIDVEPKRRVVPPVERMPSKPDRGAPVDDDPMNTTAYKKPFEFVKKGGKIARKSTRMV